MSGLHVYRASRLEALAETLAGQLAAQPAASVLAPQTVVVAHLGMKRWLLSQLAQRRNADGSAGIAANLELLLPGEWWQRLGDAVLGAADARPWQHAVLRWRIDALLAAPPARHAPELRRYLHGAPPRRRWQLAEHLARLFGEYQVYREDWLRAWADGRDAAAAGWQAWLWRRLLADGHGDARVERSRRLLAALAAAPPHDAAPVQVFGVSHLPPMLLQGLHVLARTHAVTVYFPDLCRELWDDLRSRRSLLRAGADAEPLHYEVGHPLLASLGRIGQDFTLALNADDTAQHWRDADDEADAALPAGTPLLRRLQESIRRLDPALAGAAPLASARADASLRVHVCHSRLRELEALRDALLGLRAAHPDLEPRQIVVMAPDIQAYAPLLPAVFGAPGHWHDAGLPYHLADVALAATHPVYAAWRRLLQLAQSRCTLDEVLGLLDVPALARRFGLAGAARARVADWLRAAHVAWALDAGMKPAFGAPAEDLHTFAFGLDRLLAGWLIGDEAPATVLHVPVGRAEPIVPLAAVAGSDFERLAGLARLLDELGAWRTAAATARSAAQWSAWLAQRIDAGFAETSGDDAASRDEQLALLQLRQLAARPAVEASLAGVDEALPWEVIVAQQRAALDEIPSRQPYLAAGITFCGMVPQRTIPHRVVAILGLDEGMFPRAPSPSSLDLIARHPRRGDRSALEEDRYLFLEALLAARDAMHLSYVGENANDGSARNPAAPLAELLAFLDETHTRRDDTAPPWLLRHALQPFAALYFEQPRPGEDWYPDPALRSFAHAYAAAAGAGDAPGGARPVLPAGGLPPPVTAGDAPLELAVLRAFLRKPAQAQARALLGVRLLEDEDADADDEPLAARPAAKLRLPARVFEQALAQGMTEMPMRAPAWLARSGQLPAGAAGQEAWREIRASVQAALALLANHPCRQARRMGRACRFTDAAGHVLQGSVPVLRDVEGRDWLLSVQARKELDFSVFLPLWLDWAACVLDPAAAPLGGCLLLHLRGDGAELIDTRALATRDDTLLRAGVARLLALHDAVLAGSAWYFPATAWAAACDKPAQRRDRARTAWFGKSRQEGERDRTPAYAALLTRGREWIDDATEWRAFEAQALALRALLGDHPEVDE